MESWQDILLAFWKVFDLRNSSSNPETEKKSNIKLGTGLSKQFLPKMSLLRVRKYRGSLSQMLCKKGVHALAGAYIGRYAEKKGFSNLNVTNQCYISKQFVMLQIHCYISKQFVML